MPKTMPLQVKIFSTYQMDADLVSACDLKRHIKNRIFEIRHMPRC